MDMNEIELEEFLRVSSVRKKKARPLYIFLLLLVLCMLAAVFFFGSREQAVDYVTELVEVRDVDKQVSANGRLQPLNVTEVGSEQSGIVTDV